MSMYEVVGFSGLKLFRLYIGAADKASARKAARNCGGLWLVLSVSKFG